MRDKEHDRYPRGAAPVTASQSQISSRQHDTTDQRQKNYYDEHEGQQFVAGSLRRLLLPARLVPGIDGFEVDQLAAKRRGLDVYIIFESGLRSQESESAKAQGSESAGFG